MRDGPQPAETGPDRNFQPPKLFSLKDKEGKTDGGSKSDSN